MLGNLSAPRLAVASFLVESGGRQLHPKFVVRLLSDLFGIQGRAGCSCAGPYGHALLDIDDETSGCFLHAIEVGYEGVKPGWARVSFHYLLTDEELDFILDAVAFVAEHGHRFVRLYEFDWRSGSWRHRSETGSRHAAFDPDAWAPVSRSTRPLEDDFSAYLEQAHTLARELDDRSAAAEGVNAPEGLDPRTLWFAV